MGLQSLTQDDLVRIPLKRKWWILVSLITCMTLAAVAWKYFPKTFKSTVVITIDSPRVAKDYVKGLSPEGRPNEDPSLLVLQQVTIGLTNKSILMPILDTLKPYSTEGGVSTEVLLKRLRKAITVAKPKDGVGVAISYTHSDPHVSQAVAVLLAGKLQEDNLRRREGLVENTTEFISAELDRVKADLDAKEHTISEFKKSHMGELPQQMEANLRALDRLQMEITNSSDSLSKLSERLTALEKAIKEFSDVGPAGFIPFEKERRMGDVRPIDPRSTRLRELRQKLNELLATYKENYPDIVYLKEEIHRLESAPQVDGGPSVGVESFGGREDDNSGNTRKPIDPYLRGLIKERNEVKSEMVYLKEKQGQATRQMKELEARVERTPTREQSLAILLRDYENMQKSYQSLLEKRTNVRILENYESRQFGEQYRIIEPANFPEEPEPPTKLHFLLGGFMLGCLIGFGSAIGVELLKTGFRRPEEAENFLGLPVIASIPKFSSATSGIGMLQARALLTGPNMPQGTSLRPPSYLDYLGYRGKEAKGKYGKKGYVESVRELPQNFHLIAKWGPASLMAEQYRVAATRLILMTAGKKHVVTLVTSSVMGEGKTTTAVNLAYILAHDLKKSTLLIDCDFKRPLLHEYAGISAGPGLTDVIQGSDLIENCLHRYEDLPLWIFPAGRSGKRPIGLSGIHHVGKLLPELRTRYDHIILDAPPVMPLADVNVLNSMADMLVFVIRAGTTSQDLAKKSIRSVGETGEAGIILTQVEMEYAPYFNYPVPYTNEDVETRA